MVQGILVDIAEIDFQLGLVVFQHWMWDLHVLRSIFRWNRDWWLTIELAVLRYGSREYNAGHEPTGWNFAQENKKHGPELPSAPVADASADHILGIHCDHGRHVDFVNDWLLALAAARHNGGWAELWQGYEVINGVDPSAGPFSATTASSSSSSSATATPLQQRRLDLQETQKGTINFTDGIFSCTSITFAALCTKHQTQLINWMNGVSYREEQYFSMSWVFARKLDKLLSPNYQRTRHGASTRGDNKQNQAEDYASVCLTNKLLETTYNTKWQ